MRIPRQAARVAVLDPTGSVFMFRYANEEVGVHWAMPGGGLDPGESLAPAGIRSATLLLRMPQTRASGGVGGRQMICPVTPSRCGRRNCLNCSPRYGVTAHRRCPPTSGMSGMGLPAGPDPSSGRCFRPAGPFQQRRAAFTTPRRNPAPPAARGSLPALSVSGKVPPSQTPRSGGTGRRDQVKGRISGLR